MKEAAETILRCSLLIWKRGGALTFEMTLFKYIVSCSEVKVIRMEEPREIPLHLPMKGPQEEPHDWHVKYLWGFRRLMLSTWCSNRRRFSSNGQSFLYDTATWRFLPFWKFLLLITTIFYRFEWWDFLFFWFHCIDLENETVNQMLNSDMNGILDL